MTARDSEAPVSCERRRARRGEVDESLRASDTSSGVTWKTVARWGITLGLLGVLVLVADVRSVLRILSNADPLLFLVALLVAIADRGLMIGKWIPLVRVLVPGVPILPAAKAYLGASFASLFLPSSVGGDAVRAYAIGKNRDQITEVAVSILVERVLGFLGLTLVAGTVLLLALGSVPEAEPILPWVLVGGVGAFCLVLLPIVFGSGEERSGDDGGWWGKIRSLWNRILTGYRRYADYPRRVAVVGVLSALEQLVPIVIIWLLARALDVPAGMMAVALATPLSMFLMRLPIAIDGIGLVEGALVYFLGLFGVGADQALAIAVANRAVTTMAILPGAAFVSDLPASRDEYVRRGDGGADTASDAELTTSSPRTEGVSPK